MFGRAASFCANLQFPYMPLSIPWGDCVDEEVDAQQTFKDLTPTKDFRVKLCLDNLTRRPLKGHRQTKRTNFKPSDGNERQRTTLVILCTPSHATRRMLLDILDEREICTCNFVHLAMDFVTWQASGHAWINFTSPGESRRAMGILRNCAQLENCIVTWSESTQGLPACIERFCTHPPLTESIPDDYKPSLVYNGVLWPFPGPNLPIRHTISILDALPRRSHFLRDHCAFAASNSENIRLLSRNIVDGQSTRVKDVTVNFCQVCKDDDSRS